MDGHADPSYHFLTDPHPSSSRIACVSPTDVRVIECDSDDDAQSPFYTVAAFPHTFPLGQLAWSPDPSKTSFFAGSVVSTGRIWLFHLDPSLHSSQPTSIPSYRTSKSSTSPPSHHKSSSVASALHRASQKSRQKLYGASPLSDDVVDVLDDTDIETDAHDYHPSSRKYPPLYHQHYSPDLDPVDAIDVVFEDTPDDQNIPSHHHQQPSTQSQTTITNSKDSPESYTAIHLDPRSSRPLNSLAFDPIQPNIITAAYTKARDHGLYFWDITKPSNPLVSFAYGEAIQSIAFVPQFNSSTSSSVLLAGIGSKNIRVFDRRASPATSTQLTFTTTANSGIVADPFQPYQFASYSASDCTVKLWDVRKPSYALTTFVTNTASSNSLPASAFSSSSSSLSVSKSLPGRSLTFSPSTVANTIGRSTLKSRSGARSGTTLAENIILNTMPRSDSPPNQSNSNLSVPTSSYYIEEVKFSPKMKGLLGVLHRGASSVQLWHHTNAANEMPWLLSQACSPSFSQPISSFEFSPPSVPSSSLHQIYGLLPSQPYPFSTQEYLRIRSHHEIHPLEDIHSRTSNPPQIEIVRNNGAAQLSWLKGAAFASSFGNPDTLRIVSPKVNKALKRAFQLDIAIVMERRLLSHGYSIDAVANANATNDPQLRAFWAWIVHAQDLARDGRSQIGGFSFAFKGIKDILNGFSPSTPAENKRQSRLFSHRGFLDPKALTPDSNLVPSQPSFAPNSNDTDLSKIPVSSADLLEGLKDSLYKSDMKAAQEEEFSAATGRFLQGTIAVQERQSRKQQQTQQVGTGSSGDNRTFMKNRVSNKLSSRPQSSELPDQLISSIGDMNITSSNNKGNESNLQSVSSPATANVSPSASRSTSHSRAETPLPPSGAKPLSVSKTYPPDPIRSSNTEPQRGRGHTSTFIAMSSLPPPTTTTITTTTNAMITSNNASSIEPSPSSSSSSAPIMPFFSTTDAKRLLSSESTRAGPSKSSPTGTISAFQQKSMLAKNQHVYANVVGGSSSMVTRRRAALVTLGPDFARDDASIIQECANRGEIERATAWALWTDRTEDAISILRSSKNHDIMLLAPVLAGYLLHRNQQQPNTLQRYGSERSETSATDIESVQGGEKSNTSNSSFGGNGGKLSDGKEGAGTGGSSASPSIGHLQRHSHYQHQQQHQHQHQQVARQGVEYRELCSALGTELEDPFLRASFVYMANGDWHDVLEEVGLPLRDRLAVALKYLEDDQLFRFVDTITSKVISAGELEAVVVTGLVGECGESLLQNYLDRTTDIQTVALASSFPQETTATEFLSGSGVGSTATSSTRERWANAYRGLLDDWQQFSERVKFDQWRSKRQFFNVGSGGYMTKVPENMGGVIVRCRYCDGPAHIASNSSGVASNVPTHGRSGVAPAMMDTAAAATAATSTTGVGATTTNLSASRSQMAIWNSNNKGYCKRCGQGLPRCSICLERLDLGCDNNLSSSSTTSSANVWMWCQYCRHGGHSDHLREWFDHSSVCAVAGCDCVCR